jgi:hypothetical protein
MPHSESLDFALTHLLRVIGGVRIGLGILAGGCRHWHPLRDAGVVRKASDDRGSNREDGLVSRRRPCVACASVRGSHATSSSSTAVECGASGLGREPPPPPTVQSLLPRLRRGPCWPGRRLSRGSTVCICGPNRLGRARCAPVVQSSEQSWNECTSSEAREFLSIGSAGVGIWPANDYFDSISCWRTTDW